MSQFLIPQYRLPSVLPQGRLPASQGVDAPAGAFGADSRQLQQSGRDLGVTADVALTVEQQMAKDANQTRVQQDTDKFMAGTDAQLFTADDAFFKKKGQAAIDGAPGAIERLNALKDTIIGGAANDDQKSALSRMLTAQTAQIRGQISRHVSTEFGVLQGEVAHGSIQVARNKAALNYNDPDLTDAMVMRAEGAAKELAKTKGVTGTDEETAMITTARAQVLGDVIDSRLRNDDKRGALAMWDKVRDRLDHSTALRLDAAMKSTRVDVDSDNLIARMAPNETRQSVRKFWEAKGYSPEAASALTGNFDWESGGFNPGAVNPKDGRDGSDSVGIGQWNGPRAQALKKFAADNKMDPGDRKTQLEFAAYELENSETGTRDALKKAKTLEEANSAAVGFFRPAGWTAQTPDKAHGLSGRLSNSYAAMGDSGVGFDKANLETVKARVMGDAGSSLEVRTAAAAKIDKFVSTTESARTAQIKGLRDTTEATTMQMIVSPNSVPKGRLSELADGFEQAGEKSEALTVRLLAQNEDLLRTFMTSTDDGQRRVLAAMLSGKTKSLAEGLIASGKEGGAENTRLARESFSALKEVKDIDITTMGPKIADTIKMAQQGNDKGALAREVFEWADAQGRAQAVGKAPLVQQQMVLADLKDRIEKGDQANGTLMTYDFMKKAMQQQTEAFGKDALAAGASLYSKELGPLPAINDLAGRAAYAEHVSARRGGLEVAPFTEQEFADLRTKLAAAKPEEQGNLFRQLSALPAEAIPRVAAGIAGKHDASDPQSRMYAAALSFYAEKDPASQQIANQILQGAQITKEMGTNGKKPPISSDAWQQALQTKMGNAFIDMGGKVPAVIADAVQGVYTYQMHQAGRQADHLDPDVLDRALNAVVGETITRNGQMLLPPKGVGSYQFDNAVRTLNDGDVKDFKTLNGSPVTAEKIARYGTFRNAGKDGLYYVYLPDSAAGGQPAHVQRPDGSPYVLDIKTLLARPPESAAIIDESGVKAARRRAPASPTANVEP